MTDAEKWNNLSFEQREAYILRAGFSCHLARIYRNDEWAEIPETIQGMIVADGLVNWWPAGWNAANKDTKTSKGSVKRLRG